MNISGRISKIFQKTKSAVGEAVVGDDFFRQSGTVDGVMLGAAGGAAVGGILGATRGLYHQAQDQVTEVQTQKSVGVPSLEGHRYSVREDWDEDMFCDDDDMFCDEDLSGWWHNYSPDIRNRIVGTYDVPELKHSHSATVVGSAVSGAAIGAGVGAALGLATGVVGRLLGGHPMERKHRLPDQVREKLINDTGSTVVKSTAIGAGVGAALGLSAGLLEQSKAASIERTFAEPVTVSKNLGSIPRDHYEWNHGSDWADPGNYRNHSPKGDESVVRQTPVLDSAGNPTYRNVTREFDSSRLSPVSGMVTGALTGAGVGFAVGIASSVVNRLLVQNLES
jgi:hypothetical protein